MKRAFRSSRLALACLVLASCDGVLGKGPTDTDGALLPADGAVPAVDTSVEPASDGGADADSDAAPALDSAAPPLFFLAENGQAASAILVGAKAPKSAQAAAKELQLVVLEASGAKLPILSEAEESAVPAGHGRVVIGDGTIAAKLKLDSSGLAPEEFRAVTRDGKYLVFLGEEGIHSEVALWAVVDFLDRELGARWLWPGELGLHVPTQKTIGVRAMDRTGRPKLELRAFTLGSPTKGGLYEWGRRHQVGYRRWVKFNHCFGDWWTSYGKTKPGLFAVPPAGFEQPYPQEDRVKLNLGNPAVTETILAEWRAKGRPGNWCVGPNDGSGFCTGKASRQMDLPDVYDPLDIWKSARDKVSLTRRYVTFWNNLAKKMRAEKPGVVISTYAYSLYKSPPPAGLSLEPEILISMIPSYLDQKRWDGWRQHGAKEIFLRPNWWHMGGSAPHLPLRQTGAFLEHALANGMFAFRMDQLFGFWGTQGALYYLGARVLERPELTVEEIIDEYLSAFGAAAPEVRKYLDYWESFTKQAAYPFPVGGAEVQDPNSLYQKACQGNFTCHPLVGSWRVIPYIYTDAVLAGARKHLTAAAAAVQPGSKAAKRVAMLADALDLFEQRRELIRLMYKATRKPGESDTDFKAAVSKWTTMRDALVKTYGPVMEGEAIPGRLKTGAAAGT